MSIAKIACLSQASQSFLVTVRGGNRERNNLISIAAARAIVDRLQLPSSAVADANEYFAAQFTESVEKFIGEINELVVLDLKGTCERVCEIWKLRYRVLFPVGRIYAGDNQLATFLGLSGVLSKELNETIVLKENDLVRLSNGFADMLRDLCPMDDVQGRQDVAL